jgi:hypothetical protein
MPAPEWNAQLQNKLSSDVGNAESMIATNFTTITNQSERAGLKLQGAQDQIDTAKRAIDVQLQTIENATKIVNDAIDGIAVRTQNVRMNIESKLETSDRLKSKLETVKNIVEVRNEQVHDLQNKGASNFHTSWLGLWRPLASESRTGLLIASIVFGVIGLVSIVFLLIEPVGKLLPAQITNPSYAMMPFQKK